MIAFLILLILLSPGLYFEFKYRDDGKFKIEQQDNQFVLLYNHKGEWLYDSTHPTEQLAEDRIAFYLHRKSERNLRTANF